MTYSAEETHTTQSQLRDAIEDRSFAEFNQHYVDFLGQFAAFNEARSSGPTDLAPKNAIFGETGFYLHKTNDDQAERMLQKARALSEVMKDVPIDDRLRYLELLKTSIDKYQDAIITTIVADTGKPLDNATKEMTKGGDWFKFAAEQATAQLGGTRAKQAADRWEPSGAAQVIGAYNYPYALAVGGIVGALAAGNGVIVAAPAKAPNWIFPFMEAAKEATEAFAAEMKVAGKPYADDLLKAKDGLVQYSVGRNDLLTTNADLVHFVGSTATGNAISKNREGKKTILEMGGTNVVTVMDSALSVMPAQKIADTIYDGFGPTTGQRCTAPRILSVQTGAGDVAKALAARCESGPENGKIGNPFTPGVTMGPLVDAGAHQAMEDAITLAKDLKATVYGTLKVSSDVVPLAGRPDSYWVNPIAIDWTTADLSKRTDSDRVRDRIQSEIFGPLIHIVKPFDTLDKAIAITNNLDDRDKLAGAIFTGVPADTEKYRSGTRVTSIVENGAPKDMSPEKPHGHPGMMTIGGDTHFRNYAKPREIEKATLTPIR